MRKELLAALLISAYWIVAGFVTAYSAWQTGARAWEYMEILPDPYSLGLLLAIIGVVLTFVTLRALLPSRATQRRRLLRLLDEVGLEDADTIQRKLSAIRDEYGADTIDRAASLEALLTEQKRKNRAD